MINILICDDNEQQVAVMNEFLIKYNTGKSNIKFVLLSAYNTKDALKYINSTSLDIALLDIEIGKNSGFELAKAIKEKDPNTLIIFVTNYDSYAYSAYEIEAFAYLLKPITYDKFENTLNKVINYIVKNNFANKYMVPKLKIKFKGETSYISQRDIIYIEKVQKKVIIHTLTHNYEYTISLKELENLLSKDLFIRCHSGFIVNCNYITSYKKLTIHLSNNSIIPVSKGNSNKVLEVLENKLWGGEL